jgi:cell wall-associated NlpC family hydrolase
VAAGTAGGIAVDWALAQVGTPYIWGGETPGVGFDCSGLTQAAYRVAGIALPRTAQEQYDAGPRLPPGTPLEPGDLVFLGGSGSTVGHVGIYVGTEGAQTMMVDAPHTGANVRVEPFPTTVGASFGGMIYVGATRPSK